MHGSDFQAGHDAAADRPLDGIRVVELTIAIAAPFCGRHLAQHGAEVIKVESRRHPDSNRLIAPVWLPERAATDDGMETGFMTSEFIGGKRSLCLDITDPRGRDVVLRLMAHADVVISNFAAPVLPKLGLGYENACQVRPDIIYAVMPAFGSTPSRYRDYRAWGPNLAPLCGLDHLTGWADRAPTGMASFAYPDYVAGNHMAVAILAAVLQRDVTGDGQFIDMSQYESTVAAIGPTIMQHEQDIANSGEGGRDGNQVPWAAPHGVYPARGRDRWVAIACEVEEHWSALCRLARREPFASDTRYRSGSERYENRAELDADLTTWTRGFDAKELAYRLQELGCPAAAVQDAADLAVDPHLEAREFFQLAPHARLGADLSLGYPAQMSGTPARLSRSAPRLGEDNDFVLEQLVGMSAGEHAELVAAGVVEDGVSGAIQYRRPYGEWARKFIRRDNWPEPVIES
jgi:benzylsuccinate CoA-transferase BbsF subunit